MERLHLLLPALGPAVRALALQQVGWDEERALTMLRRFQVGAGRSAGCHGVQAARGCCCWPRSAADAERVSGWGPIDPHSRPPRPPTFPPAANECQVARSDDLSKLHKERRKHQMALQSGRPEKRKTDKKEGGGDKKRRRRSGSGSGSGSDSGSDSGSSSGSDSGSSSGSEDEGRRRSKGGKRRRGSRSRSPKRGGSSKKERSRDKKRGGGKDKRKKERKDKKRKKERKEKKAKVLVGACGCGAAVLVLLLACALGCVRVCTVTGACWRLRAPHRSPPPTPACPPDPALSACSRAPWAPSMASTA